MNKYIFIRSPMVELVLTSFFWESYHYLGVSMGISRAFRSYKLWMGTKKDNYKSKRNDSFFSGEYTVKDPVLDKVSRVRAQGHHCVLILLNLDNFGQMLNPGHYEQILIAQRMICQKLNELLPVYFNEDDVIGIKQFHGEDYCVFLRLPSYDQYLDIHYKSLLIRDELVNRLETASHTHYNGKLTFGVGFFIMEKEPVSTWLSVSIAFHYAQAIATKKLPVNFDYTRKQLLDIINKEEINVLCQPIMDLRSGDIFGWEMLSRGPKDTPFYAPTDLFEFAYQADLLTQMEFIVFKKALREIAERPIREQVFINITSETLIQPFFYDQLVEYLSLFPSVRASQIVLEITERHSIRDFRQMCQVMKQYRSLGFRFALDDAGAGYASLQSISELIPDMIKIDRSIIQNIDQGGVKQSLLKALMKFAEDINCAVIAEGIETEEEAEILYQHSVTMAQGYYFLKPTQIIDCNSHRAHFETLKDKIRIRSKVGLNAI
jgi:EAL domain-containing protein (putative c-di-GMP-specific phosphodiesterase class I)